MSQAFDKFPKTSVGTHQEEQIWRDWEMFNIHINSHKLRWMKDITDIMDCHRFKEDFCNIPDLDHDWNLTEDPIASGLDVPTCTDLVNGVLQLVTNDTEGGRGELTQMCECWQFVSCYPLYGEIRFQVDNAVESDFWFGYIDTHSWFTLPNDYAVFHKDDGTALLNFATANTGVPTNTTGFSTLAEDTWYRLGIHWDGDGTVRYFLFQDGNFPQTVLATGSHTTNIPAVVMTFGFGIRTGEDADRTLSVDYVKSAQLRVIA